MENSFIHDLHDWTILPKELLDTLAEKGLKGVIVVDKKSGASIKIPIYSKEERELDKKVMNDLWNKAIKNDI